jgi:hypothetical protein
VIRRRGEFVFACALLVAVALGALWLAVFQPAATEYSQLAQGLVVIWLCGWLIALRAEVRTVVTTDGVEVTNFGVRYWVPLAAVSSVRSTDEVVLQLVGGKPLKPAAGAWSLASRARGNPVQRDLSASITSAMREARANPAADRHVRRKPHLRLVPALIALAILEGAAYLGSQL